MQLTKNFYLSELTRSQTATRKGISNEPTENHLEALKLLCENILQPVRDRFGVVVISSGYRSPKLNKAIGGSGNSQHCHGQAADFEVPGVSNKVVAQWIKKNLPCDQLILEYYDGVNPNSGWIHCSYSSRERNQFLVFNGGQYQNFVA